MDFAFAVEKIRKGISNNHLVIVFGSCEVDYQGRAISTLSLGKRLVLIKGDGSISIHQNRLVRPANYMVGAQMNISFGHEQAILSAVRLKPKESLKVVFHSIDSVESMEAEEPVDLRLSGSEKDLNDLLMQDLSIVEPGLKPIDQQKVFRTGIADIIAEDKEGRLVVIELKRREADYASVTQLHRYMHRAEKIRGAKARGILLAPSIRKNAKELLGSLGLEYAKLDFELLPSSKDKARIKGLEKSQQTIRV